MNERKMGKQRIDIYMTAGYYLIIVLINDKICIFFLLNNEKVNTVNRCFNTTNVNGDKREQQIGMTLRHLRWYLTSIAILRCS